MTLAPKTILLITLLVVVPVAYFLYTRQSAPDARVEPPSVPNSAAPADDYVVFDDLYYGLQLPAGWTGEPSGETGSATLISSPIEDSSLGTAFITITTSAPIQPGQISFRPPKGSQIIDQSLSNDSLVSSLKSEYTIKGPSQEMHYLTKALAGKVEVTATFQANAAQWNNFGDIADTILDSLYLKD